MKNKKLLLIAFSVINFTLFTKAQQIDKLINPGDGITMKFDQILEIDVSNIPHGFYTVKLENEGNFSSHKLLKND